MQQYGTEGVSFTKDTNTTWAKWHKFTAWLGVYVDLSNMYDPVPIL